MTITVDWANKVVEVSTSILDMPEFHLALRDLEDDPTGMIHPVIHRWKALDLGGGAFFYQADFINGYRLKFPDAGSYTIIGNLNADIVPVAGVFVERKTSAAFTTTSVGGTGPTLAQIADAVWQRLIENGKSAEEILRVMLAPLTCTASGIGTDTEVYYAQDGITPRVTAEFDGSGNRTAVTLNGG